VPFLAVSLLAGITQGVAQTGGMRGLLAGTGPTDRAGLLATVFLLNYSSAAIPSLIAGRLTTTFTLLQIAAGYAVLVLIGVLVVLILARPRTIPATHGSAACPAPPYSSRAWCTSEWHRLGQRWRLGPDGDGRAGAGSVRQTVWPPSTTRACPMVKAAVGEHSQSTAEAISSGRPRRPMGSWATIWA
jgi:hypothetical protein